MLKHLCAHGRLSDAECYDCDTSYECWLVYIFVCKPVLESLD